MLKDGVKHERHRLLADALGVLMNVTGISPEM